MNLFAIFLFIGVGVVFLFFVALPIGLFITAVLNFICPEHAAMIYVCSDAYMYMKHSVYIYVAVFMNKILFVLHI